MSRDKMLESFIAQNGVTVCESTGSHKDNAKSLRTMRNKDEAGEDPFDLQREEGEEIFTHVVDDVLVGGERVSVRVNADGEPC